MIYVLVLKLHIKLTCEFIYYFQKGIPEMQEDYNQYLVNSIFVMLCHSLNYITLNNMY